MVIATRIRQPWVFQNLRVANNGCLYGWVRVQVWCKGLRQPVSTLLHNVRTQLTYLRNCRPLIRIFDQHLSDEVFSLRADLRVVASMKHTGKWVGG